MSLRYHVTQAVAEARDRAIASGALTIPPDAVAPDVELEGPANPAHGDWATNAAMKLAPLARSSPMRIAQTLLEHFEPPASIAEASVAAPGFINFRLSPEWVAAQVGPIRDAGSSYGC